MVVNDLYVLPSYGKGFGRACFGSRRRGCGCEERERDERVYLDSFFLLERERNIIVSSKEIFKKETPKKEYSKKKKKKKKKKKTKKKKKKKKKNQFLFLNSKNPKRHKKRLSSLPFLQ